jgi:branched-chain amino acid transport system ATP-binding protein
MLDISNISASYGIIKVIANVSLTVEKGECVALLGSNGAGKSTILKNISGWMKPLEGAISFLGKRIDGLKAFKVAQVGIAHVPEGRRVFPQMTVEENLDIGSYLPEAKKDRKKSKEWVFHIFPRLQERRLQLAGTLSGGEQQMVAVGRALMLKPKLLMLDELSLGLAPVVVDDLYERLKKVRQEGVSILLVEQDVLRALDMADRGYVLENGRMSISGSSLELSGNSEIKKAYLGM